MISMKKTIASVLFFTLFQYTFAQKKVLDHSVYDGWQSIEKIALSKDGRWIVYQVKVQEGDDELVIQSSENTYKKIISRGYDAVITGDSKAVVFKIKPWFNDTRQARIKKKKADEMPKDSLGILLLGKDEIEKYPNLISYKTSREANEWVAALFKNTPAKKQGYKADAEKDSLHQYIDSLNYVIQNLTSDDKKEINSDHPKNNRLLLVNTTTGTKKYFSNVREYLFNKNGNKLLTDQILHLKDSIASARIVLYDLIIDQADTLKRGGKDFKELTLSDDGSKAAFVAQAHSKLIANTKYYTLWYFNQEMDSARLIVDTLTKNFPKGHTVSEYGKIEFNKSGDRIIFGTAPLLPPKDTTLIEIDKVNVDVWHYKEDYLQPYQLENQKRDREKSYSAVYDLQKNSFFQIGTSGLPNVYLAPESDGRFFMAVTDTGRRGASQWTGNTYKNIYKNDAETGQRLLLIKNLDGDTRPSWVSPSGKYVLWYDNKTKQYICADGSHKKDITTGIKHPLYNEENDVPDNPNPYGIMGWEEGDAFVLIYDRYDIWRVDPSGKSAPVTLTKDGRRQKTTYRYIQTNPDEKYINPKNKNLLSVFDNKTKKAGIAFFENNMLIKELFNDNYYGTQPYYFDQITKAASSPVYAYTKENYKHSPNVFVYNGRVEMKLSSINPQQESYNWGNASLYYWKTFSGKPATGILYRPEDFDSTKKYPVLLYFYEKLSDGLYRYHPPSPTPSRLNISFFVSRGYIVLAPDISYTIGHPAKSAYDFIVSGAKDLTKHNWVDSRHIGIQGQSWGGIQVAQLITMTNMFAAAWAGAPVANMTSAYGGIRWKGGVNRQFQYEKTQSRIGATLWQKPALYIENSPLFQVPKITTPLVIMANDNDGAVPWYQGIELFTAMRRLEKKVWMLNYNGEEHNLVQRKNRKDIQIREQQYFDWLLKGFRPAKWLTEGVPAVDKGIQWGLELEE